VVNEFAFQGPFLKLGQNVGLLVGAVVFGVGSDIWGRKYVSFENFSTSRDICPFFVGHRLSFNLTLFITGVFALSAGASPNSITLCSLAALWSIGVGGNLPVDSAVFLGMLAAATGPLCFISYGCFPEFVPASHQYLLTVLSIWWALGQFLGSLVGLLFLFSYPTSSSVKLQVAWPLIANFSCPTTSPPSPCPRSENQGWRYFLYTMGALMLVLFVLRFFVFHLYESPKFLMGRGRDAEAVEVVHKVAQYNGTTSSLTLDMLHKAEQSRPAPLSNDAEKSPLPPMETSKVGAIRRTMRGFGWDHVTPLFKTRKLARSTSLLITLWGARSSQLSYSWCILTLPPFQPSLALLSRCEASILSFNVDFQSY